MDPRIDAALAENDADDELLTALSEMRLVKDDFEVAMLQQAVDSTIRGFEDVVKALPDAMESGERVVEGVFNARARLEGNDTGYSTIAASGAHATVLHWVRNDGDVNYGDLLLRRRRRRVPPAVHRRRDPHDPGVGKVHAPSSARSTRSCSTRSARRWPR